MISWFSIRKNVRAMRLPSEDRISQSPAPSESTSGFPTGQAHCTARISEPICFRFSTGRLFSHSLTGSLPDSVAKNRVVSGRGAEGISLFVSKMMRVSKSECHTPAGMCSCVSPPGRQTALRALIFGPLGAPPLPWFSIRVHLPSFAGTGRFGVIAPGTVRAEFFDAKGKLLTSHDLLKASPLEPLAAKTSPTPAKPATNSGMPSNAGC